MTLFIQLAVTYSIIFLRQGKDQGKNGSRNLPDPELDNSMFVLYGLLECSICGILRI